MRFRYAIALLATCLVDGTTHAATDEVGRAISAGDFALADELLAAEIVRTPADPTPRFRRARVLRYAEDFSAALEVLDRLRSEYPRDVDYAFERALVHAALGDDTASLSDVEDAIRLAPDYEDLWVLRFRLLSKDPSLADDDTIADWQTEAESRFPGRHWSDDSELRDPADWSLTIGGGYDELDNGFANWDRQFVGLARERQGSFRHAIEVSRNVRSSTTDYALGVTADYTLASEWLVGAFAGTAMSPEFMPRLDLFLHGGRVLPDGWIVDVGVRYREFTGTEVTSANVTVEKYFSAFRAAYRFSRSSLPDSPSFNGHGLNLNWFYSDAASLGLSFGAGREIESLGGGRLLETDVSSISLTGRHTFTPRTALDWWVGIHDQGNIYRRRFFGLAVSIQL